MGGLLNGIHSTFMKLDPIGSKLMTKATGSNDPLNLTSQASDKRASELASIESQNESIRNSGKMAVNMKTIGGYSG